MKAILNYTFLYFSFIDTFFLVQFMSRTWVDDLEGWPQIAPPSSAIHSGCTTARLYWLIVASYFFKGWILTNTLHLGIREQERTWTVAHAKVEQLETQPWILNCSSCASSFSFLFFFYNNERHKKAAKESFTLYAYHFTLQNASLPIVGNTVQLRGYFVHIWVKGEKLSTVFTTQMGHWQGWASLSKLSSHFSLGRHSLKTCDFTFVSYVVGVCFDTIGA